MNFKCIDTGIYSSNCYFVWDEKSKETVIIDGGVDSQTVLATIKANNLIVKYIILTHNHFDHMSYVKDIKNSTGAKVAVHKDDAEGLNDPMLNGSGHFAEAITFNEVDILLNEGDKIEVSGLLFEIIHTPGHSPGCISIKVDDMLFTGDTLFKGSIGRTDFVNSDPKAIYTSITQKLFTLPAQTKVYPGHGPSSTIDYEVKNNYVIRSLGE